ncbi:GNAT family N-acetyltransferase [Acuticoccus kandeliae]|uniref:GNAT family N-acetyltransferase n=1 Tax=Acuticoccus kandeliae TaxID=2073160 RepID=UPI000D3E7303|nr:GNAT family N-acetyltransferase [Acuticoccus kandeliae]
MQRESAPSLSRPDAAPLAAQGPAPEPALPLADLPADAIATVAHLTSPSVVAAIGRHRAKSNLVVAYDGDFACGLAVGVGGPNRDYELLSLFVSPFHRGRGLGRRLLDRLEAIYLAQGASVGVAHLTVDPDAQDLAILLMRAGWRRPWINRLICESTMESAFRTPWLIGATLDPRFRITAWHDVSHSAREAIEAGLGGWVAPDLNPYDFEPDADPSTSVALIDSAAGDAVRGWIVTHRISEDVLRWTCSFVDPRLEGRARIVPLWLECARRQRALAGPQRFTFAVPVEKPRMAKFAIRRMRPWLTGLRYGCTTEKLHGPYQGPR